MHLKRLVAPKNWPIKRKEMKFIARPLLGPHKLNKCLTLNIILKDILHYAKTTKEVKEILNKGGILIDKIIRKDYRFPVGIMDVIDIPQLNESYRLLYNKKGDFILHSIKKEESGIKPCKIIRKNAIKGNKIQITLYDGKNKIIKNNYAVGDSVLFDLVKKDIKEHLELKKGNTIYLTGGKHVGEVGVIEDIVNSKGKKIIFKVGDNKYETQKDFVFVIGKDKPIISIK